LPSTTFFSSKALSILNSDIFLKLSVVYFIEVDVIIVPTDILNLESLFLLKAVADVLFFTVIMLSLLSKAKGKNYFRL
jgi:hypothetical protein